MDTLELGGEVEFFKYADAPQILAEAAAVPSIPWSSKTLQALLEGMNAGELIIISAPTGVGKTTFGQTISWDLVHNGHAVLWFTLEVSLAGLLRPFVSHDLHVKTDPTDIKKIVKVSDVPMFFPKDLTQMSWEGLRSAIWQAKVKYNLRAVFIDHLHYLLGMRGSEKVEAQNLSLLIGERLRELRKWAIDNQLTIFLVSHMKTSSGALERPTIDDMRDSSFIGQEADAVFTLWRPRLENPIKKMRNGVEYTMEHSDYTHLYVDKARRTGARGEIHLMFDKGLYKEADPNLVELFYATNPRKSLKSAKRNPLSS